MKKMLRILCKDSSVEDLLIFLRSLNLEVIANYPSIKGERSIEGVLREEYLEEVVYYLKKHFGSAKLKVFTQETHMDFGRINTDINLEQYKLLVSTHKTGTLFKRKSLTAIDSTVREGLSNISYYYAMISLSSIVAGAGLIGNSPAVIIGSMVIAPLLGPNVALAFSISVGDVKLFKESVMHFLFGILIALSLGVIIFFKK